MDKYQTTPKTYDVDIYSHLGRLQKPCGPESRETYTVS
jgi:hypothetical protein